MKKALYVALGVQSLVLVGVLGALVYTALRGPPSSEGGEGAEPDSGSGVEVAVLDEEELAPLLPADAGGGAADAGDEVSPRSPLVEGPAAEVVAQLIEGNARFAKGLTRLNDPVALRATPRAPVAVVVGCSDAAAAPEAVFDQPLGALVVARTPAHHVDPGVVAAVDDALLRDKVSLVVVLGHRGCPSVAAASGPPTVQEPAIASRVRSGLASVRHDAGQEVEANVAWAKGHLLKGSRGVKEVRAVVLRAVYDERTGAVRWLDATAPGGPRRPVADGGAE